LRVKRSLRDSVLECRGHVTFGIGVDRTRLDEVLGIDKSSIRLGDAFAHTVDFGFNWAEPIYSNVTHPEFFETLAPDIVITGSELGGSLLTEFATADPKGRAFAESVVAVADACFDDRIETVDLATRQVVDTMTHFAWYSVDLRERCRENPGRFIGWCSDGTGEALRHLGIRPVMTPG
jgi:hypothetical protein